MHPFNNLLCHRRHKFCSSSDYVRVCTLMGACGPQPLPGQLSNGTLPCSQFSFENIGNPRVKSSGVRHSNEGQTINTIQNWFLSWHISYSHQWIKFVMFNVYSSICLTRQRKWCHQLTLRFPHLPGLVFTKSCLLSLSYKTTCLEDNTFHLIQVSLYLLCLYYTFHYLLFQ